MKDRFYYADTNTQPVGPLSLDEIRRFVMAGVVAPDTMVCKEGSEKWRPLTSFAAASGIAPPPRAKPSHSSMELTDDGNTPKFLLSLCNNVWPKIWGCLILIYVGRILLKALGVF